MDEFDFQWPHTRMTQPRGAGIDGLNAFSALSAQLETLSRRLDVVAAQRTRRIAVTCNYCAGNHPSHQCTVSFGPRQHSGEYLNDYTYDNYHQVWGYHPDSSWSYNYEDQYYAPNQSYTPEFSCLPPLPQEEKPNPMYVILKGISDQEERMMSQEISSFNFQNQMEQLNITSNIGYQYMASKTETENSRLGELLSKFIASNEERLINQERSIQNQEISIKNLQNQMDQMFKALHNCPQNNWCYDEDSEIDEVPEPNLQLDETRDVEKEEASGDNENKVGEELTMSTNEDEPMLLVPQVPSPQKIKGPVRFAKPCPLGSHVVDKALYDMRASTNVKPWWDEEETIEDEELVVLAKPQSPNLIIDSTDGQTPSYSTFSIGNLFKENMLGDFNAMTITNGNLPKATLFPMDGGFLNFRRGIG